MLRGVCPYAAQAERSVADGCSAWLYRANAIFSGPRGREKPLRDRVKFVQCSNPWCTERLPASQIIEHEQVCRHMHDKEMTGLSSAARPRKLKKKRAKRQHESDHRHQINNLVALLRARA